MMAVFLPRELDCQSCTEYQKKARGCKEDSPTGFMFNDEVLKRCPVKLITPETVAMIKLYRISKNFTTLPFSGGIALQPAKLVQALDHIENCINLHQREEFEKIKNKRK